MFSLKRILILIIVVLIGSLNAFSSFYEKSRAGIFYDYGIEANTSNFLTPENKVRLKNFHFAGIQVEVPYNKYLMYAFSLDLFFVQSTLRGYALMGGSTVNLSAMGALISGKIRSQIPFSFSFGNAALFAALAGGLGGTPAFTFGSHCLSREDFSDYSKAPTPFPIVFNTSAEAGFEYFLSELFGVELKAGYRVLWFLHPMVGREYMQSINVKEANKSVVAYDLSSFFAGANLKMAF